jgi:cyclophilin family peptidyl-prolyl cis-trans isomerase
MIAGLTAVAWAQDAKPAPKAGKAAAKAESKDDGDPNATLKSLLEQRDELFLKGQKLQLEYARADAKRQAAIMEELKGLRDELATVLIPKMAKAAYPLYLKDGENKDAEDVMLTYIQEKFFENKYDQVIKVSDKLIAGGRKHPALLNFDGVSHFAVQDFGKAKEILEEAKEAGGDVYNQLGSKFLAETDTYAGYWKREQAIRAKEEAASDAEKLPHVLFKTTKGDIELALFENEAPNTVANFISLVQKKKYDGTLFHRVIPNFMAQGGDPNSLDEDPRNDGQGGPGYNIPCECYQKNARMHFQGSLSMAHAGKDTGGSQFFLTHLPTSHLNGKHTVFGRIVKGLDVAASLEVGDKIISATVLNARDHKYVPQTVATERLPSGGSRK